MSSSKTTHAAPVHGKVRQNSGAVVVQGVPTKNGLYIARHMDDYFGPRHVAHVSDGGVFIVDASDHFRPTSSPVEEFQFISLAGVFCDGDNGVPLLDETHH